MYLLDTNHFSLFTLGNEAVRQSIIEVGRENVAISIITQGEMLYMAYKSERQEGNLRRVRLFLDEIAIYGLGDGIAELYGQFKAELIQHYGPKERKKLRKTMLDSLGISDNDLWIACTALHYDLSIVSTDSDFTRMQAVMQFPLCSWL